MNVNELQQLKIKELAELAAKLQIDSYSGMNKQELIVKIHSQLKLKADLYFSE